MDLKFEDCKTCKHFRVKSNKQIDRGKVCRECEFGELYSEEDSDCFDFMETNNVGFNNRDG